MGLLRRESAWTKAYRQMWQREQRFLERYGTAEESSLDRKLDVKIPPALRETLHGAFVKAFEVVFQKGDAVIRKAGGTEKRQQDFMIREYLADQRESRKNLRAFRKAAAASGRGNVALSGAAARRLSETVVSGKFLQNIPVAGAAGGAKDAVCLRRVQQYAAIKYEKRFLIRRRTGG